MATNSWLCTVKDTEQNKFYNLCVIFTSNNSISFKLTPYTETELVVKLHSNSADRSYLLLLACSLETSPTTLTLQYAPTGGAPVTISLSPGTKTPHGCESAPKVFARIGSYLQSHPLPARSQGGEGGGSVTRVSYRVSTSPVGTSGLATLARPVRLPNPLFGRRGLGNLGNTCYLSAVLGSFLTVPPFVRAMMDPAIPEVFLALEAEAAAAAASGAASAAASAAALASVAPPPPVSLHSRSKLTRNEERLLRRFRVLASLIVAGKPIPDEAVAAFKSVAGAIDPAFAGYAQQDAHELLLTLLDGWHEALEVLAPLLYSAFCVFLGRAAVVPYARVPLPAAMGGAGEGAGAAPLPLLDGSARTADEEMVAAVSDPSLAASLTLALAEEAANESEGVVYDEATDVPPIDYKDRDPTLDPAEDAARQVQAEEWWRRCMLRLARKGVPLAQEQYDMFATLPTARTVCTEVTGVLTCTKCGFVRHHVEPSRFLCCDLPPPGAPHLPPLAEAVATLAAKQAAAAAAAAASPSSSSSFSAAAALISLLPLAATSASRASAASPGKRASPRSSEAERASSCLDRALSAAASAASARASGGEEEGEELALPPPPPPAPVLRSLRASRASPRASLGRERRRRTRARLLYAKENSRVLGVLVFLSALEGKRAGEHAADAAADEKKKKNRRAFFFISRTRNRRAGPCGPRRASSTRRSPPSTPLGPPRGLPRGGGRRLSSGAPRAKAEEQERRCCCCWGGRGRGRRRGSAAGPFATPGSWRRKHPRKKRQRLRCCCCCCCCSSAAGSSHLLPGARFRSSFFLEEVEERKKKRESDVEMQKIKKFEGDKKRRPFLSTLDFSSLSFAVSRRNTKLLSAVAFSLSLPHSS